jgi:hypothetical protein
MSARTIPAVVVLTCNRCGKSGERYAPGPFCNGGMHARNVQVWGRGWGHPPRLRLLPRL